MNPPSSFLSLLTQGGLLSILILIVLIGMSVLSWAIILKKWIELNRSVKSAQQFLSRMDLNSGLSDIIHRSELYSNTFTAALFQAAYNEFVDIETPKTNQNGIEHQKEGLARIERSIEAATALKNSQFEKDLNILATISASAPFVGLFGTVTGVIDAFYNIGYQGAASIAVVAPGISAALVATAFGLFAAIPALIAYNVFRNKVRIINNDMRRFSLRLVNLFSSEFSSLKDEQVLQPLNIKLGSRA